MHSNDDIQRMIRMQYELALAGERPVFCAECHRPFKARETTQPEDVFRSVKPYRHAVAGKSREVCHGSYLNATLRP